MESSTWTYCPGFSLHANHQQHQQPRSHALMALLTCRLCPHGHDVCSEVCPKLCLWNHDCFTQPSTRRYALHTNIYKTVEGIFLAQTFLLMVPSTWLKMNKKRSPIRWEPVGKKSWEARRDGSCGMEARAVPQGEQGNERDRSVLVCAGRGLLLSNKSTEVPSHTSPGVHHHSKAPPPL